jgi:flagellar biogenesis protein FliO
LFTNIALASETGIAFKSDSVANHVSLFGFITALVICLFCGLLIIFLLKRFGKGVPVLRNSDNKIEILEYKRISTKQSILLIDVDGVSYLTAFSDNGCHILEHRPASSVKEHDKVEYRATSK